MQKLGKVRKFQNPISLRYKTTTFLRNTEIERRKEREGKRKKVDGGRRN